MRGRPNLVFEVRHWFDQCAVHSGEPAGRSVLPAWLAEPPQGERQGGSLAEPAPCPVAWHAAGGRRPPGGVQPWWGFGVTRSAPSCMRGLGSKPGGAWPGTACRRIAPSVLRARPSRLSPRCAALSQARGLSPSPGSGRAESATAQAHQWGTHDQDYIMQGKVRAIPVPLLNRPHTCGGGHNQMRWVMPSATGGSHVLVFLSGKSLYQRRDHHRRLWLLGAGHGARGSQGASRSGYCYPWTERRGASHAPRVLPQSAWGVDLCGEPIATRVVNPVECMPP
jgi:hypothetical protein